MHLSKTLEGVLRWGTAIGFLLAGGFGLSSLPPSGLLSGFQTLLMIGAVISLLIGVVSVVMLAIIHGGDLARRLRSPRRNTSTSRPRTPGARRVGYGIIVEGESTGTIEDNIFIDNQGDVLITDGSQADVRRTTHLGTHHEQKR